MACAISLRSFLLVRTYFVMIIFLVLSLSSHALEKCLDQNQSQNPTLGAILEHSSRAGREEKVGLKMAVEDFCAYYNDTTQYCPTLLVNDSLPDHPFETASLANTMIKDDHALAIFLGLEASKNAFVVAELGNKFQVPILSLANDHVPTWAHKYSPFLVNAARSQHTEMKAVAAIIRSWQWQKVNVIYEDIDWAKTGITPYLIDAIREVGSEISALLALPPLLKSHHYNISQQLESLKSQQSRVFIVHTSSITLATKLFKEAKGLGMMEEDSVWIATTSTMNQIDSLDASAISSMQGVVGVKSYFLKSGERFENFHSKFMVKYLSEYPHERNSEPGIFALQAYDAAWAVALALKAEKPNSPSNSSTGKELLKNILKSHFLGFSGQFNFHHSTLAPAHIFEMVNVVGKSYRELGFWSEGLGFSKTLHKDSKYNQSMSILGQVFWPGGPLTVPRGWEVPTSDRPLRIGVPARTTFSEFVNVKYDADGNPVVGGFSIDVFRKIVELLPYPLPYKLIPFNGSSYDSMVQQVQLEIFDGVVADTAIIAKRCSYVEFSQPYAESGLQMLILYKPKRLTKTWLFLQPFTLRMWIVTLIFNTLNGLIILWIERNANPEFTKVSLWSQMGTMLAMAFGVLFLLQGPRLSRNSTRLAFVAWMFMSLILTSSFTASLTSLLTVPQLRPTMIDIETLKATGAKVGCDANSFVVKYLEEALGFEPQNIVKIYSESEYPPALESGKIKAAFLEVPYVKLFLAKHCKNFTVSGKPLNVGGFGFAFSKKSSYLADISRAILEATESGKLLELERSLLSSYNCSATASSTTTEGTRLDTDSFTGLFIVTGLTTAFAVLMHARRRRFKDCLKHCNADHKNQRTGQEMDQLSDLHARDHDNQGVDDQDHHHHVGENDQPRSDHDHDHGQHDIHQQTVLHVNEDPPPRG